MSVLLEVVTPLVAARDVAPDVAIYHRRRGASALFLNRAHSGDEALSSTSSSSRRSARHESSRPQTSPAACEIRSPAARRIHFFAPARGATDDPKHARLGPARWDEGSSGGPGPSPRYFKPGRAVRNAVGILINPSNPQRPVYLGFDPNGKLVTVGKFSARADRDTAARERGVLDALAQVPALRGTVPRAIALIEGTAGDTLITDAFQGAAAPRELTPELHDWLRRCDLGRTATLKHVPLVRSVIARADAVNDPLLTTGVRAVLALAESPRDRAQRRAWGLRPWNILISHGEAKVFDWEFGERAGLPYWDAFYFDAQVASIWRLSCPRHSSQDSSRQRG